MFNDIHEFLNFTCCSLQVYLKKNVLHPILWPVVFRWVENKWGAIRFLEKCSNMVKTVNHLESLQKWKRSSPKSSEDLLTAVNDNLIPAKLQFFSFIASLFKPFLLKYQNEKPMLPFLHDFHFYMMIFWN